MRECRKPGENQGIGLMLETIREILGKLLIVVSLINRSRSMLEKHAREQSMPIMKFLVFIFHYGNRTHFIEMGENLLRWPFILISEICSICSGRIMSQGKQRRN